MKPDYAKATAELLDRLRRRQLPAGMPAPPPQSSHVYINAPKDCVIVISPMPKPPTRESDAQT